jgi:hypothetical protein
LLTLVVEPNKPPDEALLLPNNDAEVLPLSAASPPPKGVLVLEVELESPNRVDVVPPKREEPVPPPKREEPVPPKREDPVAPALELPDAAVENKLPLDELGAENKLPPEAPEEEKSPLPEELGVSVEAGSGDSFGFGVGFGVGFAVGFRMVSPDPDGAGCCGSPESAMLFFLASSNFSLNVSASSGVLNLKASCSA